MSHDEIETSHVNECDRSTHPKSGAVSVFRCDAKASVLLRDLPPSAPVTAGDLMTIEALVRSYHEQAKRIAEMEALAERQLAVIAALRTEAVRLRKDELAALDKGRSIAAAEYAQSHISISELATMLDMEEPSRMDVLHRLGEITEAGKQPDDTNSIRAELYAAKRATEELTAERDRALAELAEERRFARLLNAVRGGE